jgi:hypothetical protein
VVLRESGLAIEETYELRGLADPTVPIGVENCRALVGFTDALLGVDVAALDGARHALTSAMGDEALVGASLIAANFSKNDRIANAIGIPLEPDFVKQSESFREELGINDYPSASNSLG